MLQKLTNEYIAAIIQPIEIFKAVSYMVNVNLQNKNYQNSNGLHYITHSSY